MEDGRPVEFVGPDDVEARVYEGHPGRIVDLGLFPLEVGVSFVNGPSEYRRPHDLRVLSDEEYLLRGRRLVDLRHPLRDEPVPGFCLAGHEWPDGHEPRP